MDPIILFISIVLIIAVISLLSGKGVADHHSGSMLKTYAKDLTYLAKEKALDPVIGRRDEIDKVIEILSRRKKNNPLLIGRAGVGKTSIVEGLANAIANGAVPVILKDKRVLSLDLSSLVAGTKYRGEFEKRLKALVQEIISSERNIILFIDEIHTLAEAGDAQGAIDAEDILKPVLAKGDLQLIGATTFKEYHQYIAPNDTMARRFQPVTIDEPDAAETMEILQGLKSRYEGFHSVKISDQALTRIISLADKVLPDRVMPDKAIDLMDEACAKVKLDRVNNPGHYHDKEAVVLPQHIDAVAKELQEDQFKANNENV